MTLLRWIKRGAPTVECGSVGRGHGYQVEPDALERWLAEQAAPNLTKKAQRVQLETLAESLMRCYRNDQAAATVGISHRHAAAVLVMAYERLAKDLTKEPVHRKDLPREIAQLCSISSE